MKSDNHIKLLGNDVSYEKMRNMVKSKRPPLAVMIVGTEGTGKRTFALHYAMSLLCKEGGFPCFNCKSCKKALSGNHPDIIKIKGNEKTGSISVDDIRKLRQESYTVPQEGDRKVFIIEEASHLTKEAQNAFLKILEEGPVSATYILTCSNEKEILDTVISRVSVIYMPTLNDEDKEEALRRYTNKKLPDNISFICRCFPSVGKCIEVIDDRKLKNIFDNSLLLADYIKQKDRYKMLTLFSSYGQNSERENLRELLSLTMSVCLCLCKEGKFSPKDTARVLDAVSKCIGMLECNVTSLAVGAFFTGKTCS